MSIVDTLVEAFARRPEIPLRPAPGPPMGGPVGEDSFLNQLRRLHGDIEGATFGIIYVDAARRQSIRTIRCAFVGVRQDITYLAAWCLLAEDMRTFRIDNIQSVYDYRTGEPLGDPHEFIGQFVPGLPGPRPVVANVHDYSDLREAARPLLFLAMADGELHQREVDVIVSYLAARLERVVRNPVYSRVEIAAWCRNQVPTRNQALAGLRHTFDSPGERAPLVDALFEVMIADGEASDAEMNLMRAMAGSMARRESRS